MCLTPFLRIFHLYDGVQHYVENKAGSARGKPSNFRRLVEIILTMVEIVAPGSLRCASALTDWAAEARGRFVFYSHVHDTSGIANL